MPRVIGTLTGQARTHHVDAPFVIHHLWSIIGDTGGVVSCILPSALALLSFHMSTGKLGSRPVDFDHMAVFTFTRKSRSDFIEKLVKEAERWGVPLSEKKAKQIVRTFHSKALRVASGGLRKEGEGIFDFLGTENASKKASESNDEFLDALEEEANDIEGFITLQKSADQAEVLKDVYSKCYNGDEQFRKAIATLFNYTYTITTAISEADKRKYEEQLTYIDRMSKRDRALCDHLEEKWTEQNCWPIEGVRQRTESGARFPLSVIELFRNKR